MGISGFDPAFLVGLDLVRAAHGTRLAELVGRRLTGFALVRLAENGDWFADCPVVLDFDGEQVEICHWQLDELAIGWNAVDTSAPITGWERAEFTPAWSHADARLEPLVGAVLREVALLEWRPAGPDLAAGTVAVEFVVDAGRFHVANGLDENEIRVGEPHGSFVRWGLSGH